jgi:hypothetical protein
MYPTWLILEYASIFLKSLCPIAANAPTRIEIVPANKSTLFTDSLFANTEVVSRIRAYMPDVLVAMPAKSTDAAAGAAEYAAGSHP